jgi:hypothetical protein
VVHEQAAGFALDALDDHEQLDFERHLATCTDCEYELESLRATAVALAFCGALPRPRPELRQRVLAVDGVVVPFRLRRSSAILSAAAVAAACAGIGFWLHASVTGSEPLHSTATAYPLRGAEGALLVAPNGEAVLVVRRLPPTPLRKAYQVWIVQDGRPRTAGFLRGSMTELARSVLPGAEVAVTLEPATGSRHPTGPFLLRAERA